MTSRPEGGLALAVGDERVVEIGTVAHGGHFIAHTDGRTLFVRHALPGETVRVRLTEVTRKMVRADAIEVITPSPDRVTPPCAYAKPGACGGCDFQHVAVPAQRGLKEQVLRESLMRFARLTPEELAGLDLTVHELPGHPDGLHWRTRMRWAVGSGGQLGLRQHRGHGVVPVDRCLLAVEGADVPGPTSRDKVIREVRGREWRIGADDFWQVHDALPEALVAAVIDLGGPQPGETWWDLYSGAGLFSAFLGESVGTTGKVKAVEASPFGSRSARRALHDLPQVSLITSEVDPWLEAAQDQPRPDGIVLDPPRTGAGERVADILNTFAAPTIVYVACDPVALARDVARLAEGGYRLTGLKAFDAFPMTHHFETVAVLSLS